MTNEEKNGVLIIATVFGIAAMLVLFCSGFYFAIKAIKAAATAATSPVATQNTNRR
jgi:NhaP-type Na+/H+ or K+/H+ antiporter